MKRRVHIFVWLCAAALLLALGAEPLACALVKKGLRGVFRQGNVSIEGVHFGLLSGVTLKGIRVQKERVYSLVIPQARIIYDRDLFFKLALKKISLSGVSLTISLGNKSLLKLKDELAVGSGKSPLTLQALRLDGAHCEISSKDLNFRGDLSLDVNLPLMRVDELVMAVGELDGGGVHLENFSCRIPLEPPTSYNLSVDLLQLSKVKLKEVKGVVVLHGKSLLLSKLSAKVFKGLLQASGSLLLEKANAFAARVELNAIDLAELARELELREKVELSGTLSGVISLRGQGPIMEALDGSLTAGKEGGVIKVKDAAMLKGALPSSSALVAAGKLTAQDILVESLKDYHYNTGLVKLGMQGKNLLCDVALDGEAGRRDLDMVVHEFTLGRGLR